MSIISIFNAKLNIYKYMNIWKRNICLRIKFNVKDFLWNRQFCYQNPNWCHFLSQNVMAKNTENHSVTYTLSRNHQVIVQYVADETTDMFQIGRSTESAIDFIVLDTQVPHLNGKDENVSLAKTALITADNRRYYKNLFNLLNMN